jgi:6,7-dimethyl-8-ribityllumazine synthase
MLIKNKKTKSALSGKGLRIAIVAARYNPSLMQRLLSNTEKTLSKAGVLNVTLFRVPGSYEIPMVAMKLARARKHHAIITLGVIFQGKTSHAEHIALTCSIHLQQIAMETGVPVIHQILTPRNLKDARARVQLRGIEAAQAAVEMGTLMRKLAC